MQLEQLSHDTPLPNLRLMWSISRDGTSKGIDSDMEQSPSTRHRLPPRHSGRRSLPLLTWSGAHNHSQSTSVIQSPPDRGTNLCTVGSGARKPRAFLQYLVFTATERADRGGLWVKYFEVPRLLRFGGVVGSLACGGWMPPQSLCRSFITTAEPYAHTHTPLPPP